MLAGFAVIGVTLIGMTGPVACGVTSESKHLAVLRRVMGYACDGHGCRGGEHHVDVQNAAPSCTLVRRSRSRAALQAIIRYMPGVCGEVRCDS